MANSAHLQLPYIAASQAQKHVPANESFRALDALVQMSVKDRDLTSPPGSPADGDRYIPASGATGAWSTWDLNIAYYVDGAWMKLVPREGWRAWVDDENKFLFWNGSAWAELSVAATDSDAIHDNVSAEISAITQKSALASGDHLLLEDSAASNAKKRATYANLISSFSAIGQLPFPASQSASADANTLDDYEEGTFTPTFTAQTTPPSSVTYSAQVGAYTKVGNVVYFTISVVLTSKGSGGVGNAQIAGLPFTGGAYNPMAATRLTSVDFSAGYTFVAVLLQSSATTMVITEQGDNVAPQTIQWSAINNGSAFIITGFYFV